VAGEERKLILVWDIVEIIVGVGILLHLLDEEAGSAQEGDRVDKERVEVLVPINSKLPVDLILISLVLLYVCLDVELFVNDEEGNLLHVQIPEDDASLDLLLLVDLVQLLLGLFDVPMQKDIQ